MISKNWFQILIERAKGFTLALQVVDKFMIRLNNSGNWRGRDNVARCGILTANLRQPGRPESGTHITAFAVDHADIERTGEDLAPQFGLCTPADDRHFLNMSARIGEDIEAVAECKGDPLENCAPNTRRIRLVSQSEQDSLGIRIIMRRSLT